MWSTMAFTTLLVTCAAVIQSTTGQKVCDPMELTSCLTGIGDIMPGGAATIPKELDQMCKSLGQAVNCLKTKAAECIPDQKQRAETLKRLNIELLSNMLTQMCQDGGKIKTVYNKHKDCLVKISDEIHTSCLSKIQQASTSGGDHCTILSAAAKCHVAATEAACGCEAAEYPKEGFRLSQDATKFMKPCEDTHYDTTAKCKDYKYQSTGTGNSHRAAFALIIISIVYILV